MGYYALTVQLCVSRCVLCFVFFIQTGFDALIYERITEMDNGLSVSYHSFGVLMFGKFAKCKNNDSALKIVEKA